jgi:Fe2+ or Zn2+ uptake regulation protein
LEDEARTPDEVIRQILDYFLSHPEAVDSADGIAHWRLLEEVIQPSVAGVEEALRWLVSRGLLREVAVPGSRHVYTLNTDMQDRAKRFLDETRRKPNERAPLERREP